jgi:putative membrane protein
MQTPLQILKRRYAAGEIASEEYEERRARLLQDATIK